MRREQHHVAPSVDVVPCRPEAISQPRFFEPQDRFLQDGAPAPSDTGENRRALASHPDRVIATVETGREHDSTRSQCRKSSFEQCQWQRGRVGAYQENAVCGVWFDCALHTCAERAATLIDQISMEPACDTHEIFALTYVAWRACRDYESSWPDRGGLRERVANECVGECRGIRSAHLWNESGLGFAGNRFAAKDDQGAQ